MNHSWVNRGLLIGIAVLVAALAIAGALRALLDARLDQIDARIIRLSARLEPVSPEDVLCGLSDQLQHMARILANHCDTTHGVTIPPLPVPFKCRHPAEVTRPLE